MTNPVKQFRLDEKARLDLAIQALQGQLVGTDSDLTARRGDIATETSALATLQAEASRLRQALASAAMPADADAVVAQLEDNLAQQRITSAALNDATDQVARLEHTRSRVASSLDLARAQQAQAAANLVLANAADQLADRWRTALGSVAISNAIASAVSAGTTALLGNARTRLASLVGGTDLVDLFQHRFDEARADTEERHAAAVRAQASLDTLRLAQDPNAGPVLAQGAAFAAARDEAQAAAETTVQRLDQALLVLQTASALGNLTVDEQSRIDERATRATTAVGPISAFDAEKAILDAKKDVREAWVTFDTAALAKEAADPAFDRNTAASVKTQRDTWQQKQADQATAEGKATVAMKGQLDAWEVALPPALLAVMVDYLRAKTTVDEVKGLDPASLVTALDKAETDYAKALADQTKAVQLQAQVAREVAARLDTEAAVQPMADIREAALVRGDR